MSNADRVNGGHTFIDVEDRCGGLSDNHAEAIFKPFSRMSSDRTGSALRLRDTTSSRWTEP
jgi:signal transduction histidine kinase